MKKLNFRNAPLKKGELLNRAQMKHVLGGYEDGGGDYGGGGGDRCSNDRLCSFHGVHGVTQGGCHPMQNGQCRCVAWSNGVAVESVPHSGCLA